MAGKKRPTLNGSYGFMHTFCFVLGLRNARRSFGDLNSTDDWWDWTLSMLLDGLHPEGPSVGSRGTQVGMRSFPA